MRLIIITFLLAILAVSPVAVLQAQNAGSPAPSSLTETPTSPVAAAKAEPQKEGLPPKAPTVFNIGPFPVTNSMLVTWIVAVGLIIFARISTAR